MSAGKSSGSGPEDFTQILNPSAERLEAPARMVITPIGPVTRAGNRAAHAVLPSGCGWPTPLDSSGLAWGSPSLLPQGPHPSPLEERLRAGPRCPFPVSGSRRSVPREGVRGVGPGQSGAPCAQRRPAGSARPRVHVGPREGRRGVGDAGKNHRCDARPVSRDFSTTRLEERRPAARGRD